MCKTRLAVFPQNWVKMEYYVYQKIEKLLKTFCLLGYCKKLFSESENYFQSIFQKTNYRCIICNFFYSGLVLSAGTEAPKWPKLEFHYGQRGIGLINKGDEKFISADCKTDSRTSNYSYGYKEFYVVVYYLERPS